MLLANPNRLIAHQVATGIALETVPIARTLYGPGAFDIGAQIVRAANSVVSNIAEACGRGTVAEFRQFLMYARGSAQELQAQLRILAAYDANKQAQIRALRNRTTLAIKLITRLHDNPPPPR